MDWYRGRAGLRPIGPAPKSPILVNNGFYGSGASFWNRFQDPQLSLVKAIGQEQGRGVEGESSEQLIMTLKLQAHDLKEKPRHRERCELGITGRSMFNHLTRPPKNWAESLLTG